PAAATPGPSIESNAAAISGVRSASATATRNSVVTAEPESVTPVGDVQRSLAFRLARFLTSRIIDRCGSKRIFGRCMTFNRFAGLGTLHALRTLVFRLTHRFNKSFRSGIADDKEVPGLHESDRGAVVGSRENAEQHLVGNRIRPKGTHVSAALDDSIECCAVFRRKRLLHAPPPNSSTPQRLR